jgi:phosphoribosylformylglycinamidine (FGAM) synthase-like amidotransferase family enzyme
MTRKPRALVLTGYGINTDYETAHAFSLPTVAGEGVRVHLNDLTAAPQMLRDYQVFVIPGGFSFGDDIASGKVLAVKLRARLLEPLRDFVDRGRLVLGICNGFQVLVKLGLLPNLAGEGRYNGNGSGIFTRTPWGGQIHPARHGDTGDLRSPPMRRHALY